MTIFSSLCVDRSVWSMKLYMQNFLNTSLLLMNLIKTCELADFLNKKPIVGSTQPCLYLLSLNELK